MGKDLFILFLFVLIIINLTFLIQLIKFKEICIFNL